MSDCPDTRFAHHCQPLDDCMEELLVARLIHAMRPYLPSSPLPPPSLAARIPRQRRHTEVAAELRIHALRAAAPTPGRAAQSDTDSAAEPWWPIRKGVRVPPTGGHGHL